MCLSSYSTVSIEDVAESCHFKGVRFFQLYFNKNREITANLLKRAKANGYLAVALTIDTQVVGIRRADEHNKFSLPPIHELANFKWKPLSEDETNENASGSYLNNLINTGIDQSITWKDLAWIKETSQLPLILKGILNPEDAELAKEYGADAIWISNHGGRQIDGCLTPLEALPDIYQAINGSGIEIYVDGGVRKGSDAYKALALGADHVFIGRPAIYGLAVGGEEGVTAVLSILKNEFKRVMQLSGKTSVNKITRSAVIYKKP
nr:hydroxyacid oxidase [Nephromyces sp. MMRI]